MWISISPGETQAAARIDDLALGRKRRSDGNDPAALDADVDKRRVGCRARYAGAR